MRKVQPEWPMGIENDAGSMPPGTLFVCPLCPAADRILALNSVHASAWGLSVCADCKDQTRLHQSHPAKAGKAGSLASSTVWALEQPPGCQ